MNEELTVCCDCVAGEPRYGVGRSDRTCEDVKASRDCPLVASWTVDGEAIKSDVLSKISVSLEPGPSPKTNSSSTRGLFANHPAIELNNLAANEVLWSIAIIAKKIATAPSPTCQAESAESLEVVVVGPVAVLLKVLEVSLSRALTRTAVMVIGCWCFPRCNRANVVWVGSNVICR